jgi:L-alanine-DL-glutamate epimerase-like enolase superfamily enzyme
MTGRGEDVGYEAADHDGYPEGLDVAGRRTLDELSGRLDGLDLFPTAPRRAADRCYRRWAFESAALDLALRQAGRPLGEFLGLPYRAVRFVVSTRLEIEPWRKIDPELEFKLDPTPDWTADRIHAAAETGRVRALDFKGYYEGTEVDAPADPRLYRAVAESFPDAILEDPAWNEETAAALAGHESRIAWDAPIHGVDDLDRMPVAPRWLNVKPSRFGTLPSLCETLDVCRARSIACYGGGQFELGVGRAQIQGLASLFYADAPNDVAPTGYNAPEPRAGLPRSPLIPARRQEGFGFRFAPGRR